MNAFLKGFGPRLWFIVAVVSANPVLQANEPAAPPAPVAVRDGLPLHVPCRIHTNLGGEREVHAGKIMRVTAEWIVLQAHDASHEITAKAHHSPHAQVSAEVPSESEVWIPRSSLVKVTFNRPVETVARGLQPTPDHLEQCDIDDVVATPVEPVKVLPRIPPTRASRLLPLEVFLPEPKPAPSQPAEPKIEHISGQSDEASTLKRPTLFPSGRWQPPSDVGFYKAPKPISMHSFINWVDDSRLFPHGPEFILNRQIEAIEGYKAKKSQLEIPDSD